MIFQRTITTPKNTSIVGRLKTNLPVTYGAIYKVEIQLPFGSVGLLGIRILDKTYPIYPSTPDEYFTGQGILIQYDDKYKKFNEPWAFTIETYNLDDTYEHKCTVRLGMATTIDEISSLYPSEQFAALTQSFTSAVTEQTSARRNIFQKAADFLTKVGS
jgi:hypothetical protein